MAIRIGIGQINATVGDIGGNCKKILSCVEKALSYRVDIVSFPELAVTGYPPEDLLLKPKFVRDNINALSSLQKKIRDIIVVAGFVDSKNGLLYNSAAVLHNGKKIAVCHKTLLPNYGVFDEKRYFSPGQNTGIFRFHGISFGVNICEDIWHNSGPAKEQSDAGARLLVNINASPYHRGKTTQREKIVKKQCVANGVFICYTNMVGGQDELVFDGSSFIMDGGGKVVGRAESFKETLLVCDIPDADCTKGKRKIISIPHKSAGEKPRISPQKHRKLTDEEEVYLGLMAGLRDYAAKNGFRKTVLGLSGGIDSAIVAAIAADTLGAENVAGVFMPSRYSSKESGEDALKLAENLGIEFLEIPIENIFDSCLETLSSVFSGMNQDITEENLQARIRGNTVMALSNKFGWLVLTTGNKSEISVGYATLYGDMAGGFAVLKDVYKTLVYKLAEYRNSVSPVIPSRILTKPPSAELRPNQKDQDTLPPYEILDGILKEYIEKDKSYSQIISAGFKAETVKKVIGLVDRSEYKRRQAPPGVKITPKAFGRDRRMPITNRYTL
ncbi:MAG: NAD+ synthase [Candidatus Omnitrophica bacterium]|nr:NAD+ synthase [Candidatus Omnitrophota bacterium]